MKLEGLELWLDSVARNGPQSMAVDEWLLTIGKPVLRIYQWQGEWGSLGYFGSLEEARSTFPKIPQWVRRWTGGGIVDHRKDWPYTLVIPSYGRDQRLGGVESYRAIHAALANALEDENLDVKLSGGDEATGAASCFDNPVTYDLTDSMGRKLAGAGQKRSKAGLMHQGSVALPVDAEASMRRAQKLADALSQKKWAAFKEEPPEDILLKLQVRYENPAWTLKRS